MKDHKYCFHVILIIPALFLVSIVLITCYDLYQIRRITPAALLEYYQDLVTHREPVSFPLPDNIHSDDVSHKTTVFVFGSSDLLLSDGDTFPGYLAKDHPELHVVNFGVHGIDSFLIRQRVEDALEAARPDIIILFHGHNDYNGTYQGYIVPTFFNKFDVFMRLAYLFRGTMKPAGVTVPDTYYWFSRYMRAKFFQVFGKLGLVDIPAATFSPVNQSILDFYAQNHTAIIELAASRRIPVVLITPVGNLRAEPFGTINTTTVLYRKGMETEDYRRSLEYLKQARDTEIFTYDLRAKSLLIDYMRNYSHPAVHVLDLEKALEMRHYGFGYGDFLDYVHFNDRSHKMLAGIVYDFLKQKKLVGRGFRQEN